jgi:hypothetical protein
MSENEQIKTTRLKLLANPADRIINPIGEVKRLSASNTTALNAYINPNNVAYQLGKLGVDSEGNAPLQSLTSFLNGRTPITYIDADEWSGSGTYTDSVLGLSWSVVNGSKATVDGIESIDLETNNNRYMETATTNTVGQNYVHFYAWRPRVSNSGWRTLFRGDNDHWVIVQNNATDLGMYSNRNGAFRDTGYNITAGEWQTLIVVGVGDSATATTGTQTFYVNGVNVGTTDRVASGTNTYRLGWTDSQSPGYFKVAGVINSTLTSAEITELNDILTAKISGNTNTIGFQDTSSLAPDITYITDSNYSLPINYTEIKRIKSEGLDQDNPIREGKLRLQVNSGTSQYNGDTDDDFRREITKSRAIVSDVSSGGGGGSGSSGPTQTWY